MEKIEKLHNLKTIFRESKEFIPSANDYPISHNYYNKKPIKLDNDTSISNITNKIESCIKKTKDHFSFKSNDRNQSNPFKTASMLQDENFKTCQKLKILNLRNIIKKNPFVFSETTRESDFHRNLEKSVKLRKIKFNEKTPFIINSNDLKIIKPFFLSEKRSLNQEYQKIDDESLKKTHFPKTRTRVEVDNVLDYEFPMHKSIDIIKRHNAGFFNKDNLDLFNHFHRMLFKNKYFFDKKYEKLRKTWILLLKTQGSEINFSETPLPLKKFIIEKNLLDIKIYEELLQRYEEEKSLELLAPQKPIKIQENVNIIDLNTIKLQSQTDQQNLLEETFLISIMEKANMHGLTSLAPIEIIEFKKIIEKRKVSLKKLNDIINTSTSKNERSHYKTKSMIPSAILNTSQEIQESYKNNEGFEKLNRWKSVRNEDAEFLYLSNRTSSQNKKSEKGNNFQKMFKKLKEQKKQEIQERKKENSSKFKNLGNLVLRLESVKLSLLNRLKMHSLQNEIDNFHKASDPQLIFKKYLQSKLEINTENRYVGRETSTKSLSLRPTSFESSRNNKLLNDESFHDQKQDILKELLPETQVLVEKKEVKKKGLQGKLAKFHRFSMIILNHDNKTNENPSTEVPNDYQQNEIIVNRPKVSSMSKFKVNDVEMKIEKIEKKNENFHENEKNDKPIIEPPVIIDEKINKLENLPLKHPRATLVLPPSQIKEKVKTIQPTKEKHAKKRLSEDFGMINITTKSEVAKSGRKSMIIESSFKKLNNEKDSSKKISFKKIRVKNRSTTKLSKFSLMSSSSVVSFQKNLKAETERKFDDNRKNYDYEFEKSPNAWETNHENSPNLLSSSLEINQTKEEMIPPQIIKTVKNIIIKKPAKNSIDLHSSVKYAEVKTAELKNEKKKKKKHHRKDSKITKDEASSNRSFRSMTSSESKNSIYQEYLLIKKESNPKINELSDFLPISPKNRKIKGFPSPGNKSQKQSVLLEIPTNSKLTEKPNNELNLFKSISNHSLASENLPKKTIDSKVPSSKRLVIQTKDLSETRSIRYKSKEPSYENLDPPMSSFLNLNLINMNDLNIIKANTIGSRKNIPFWEEDDIHNNNIKSGINSPFSSINKIEEKNGKNLQLNLKEEKFAKMMSKQNSFNLFAINNNNNESIYENMPKKKTEINGDYVLNLLNERKKENCEVFENEQEDNIENEKKSNENLENILLKKQKKKRRDSKENPYENLKLLEDNDGYQTTSLSPKKKKSMSPKQHKQHENMDQLDLKEFINKQMEKAKQSTIKELKDEIESDMKILMSPAYIEDAKYEIFLYQERNDQISKYLKEIEDSSEKAQYDFNCVEQLADIWNERMKIFSEYDKISKMRFCNEVLIPKTEKAKIMREFYKKGSGFFNSDDKFELINYFSQLTKIDEKDHVRKKKFLIEFIVLKLIKNFLNKQRSYVKQGNLNIMSNFSNPAQNSMNFMGKSENVKNVSIKTQEIAEAKIEETSKNEDFDKFVRKLKELKNVSPGKFQKLYMKFNKTKKKFEKNISKIS